MLRIELIKDLNRIYIYSSEILDTSSYIKYPKFETIGELNISSGIPTLPIVEKTVSLSSIHDLLPLPLKCKHSEIFYIDKIKPLPREHWQDLLDYWTCCQNEQNVLLDKNIFYRENIGFVSDFYVHYVTSVAPICCRSENMNDTLYFNELQCNVNHELVVRIYLKNFFDQKNSLIFTVKHQNYEVTYFCKTHTCYVENDSIFATPAMKLGMRVTNLDVTTADHINEFYSELILKMISENFINLKILGFEVAIFGV